ncbi:hypothetical protein [Kocuria sp. NPDC057446]|uniref:hypothetical protein n=1 Tax=Kocuria sp. NPDC057446 TaxID=3346137 RepID=UPI0036AC4432
MVVDIYRGRAWYVERGEPEADHTGVLDTAPAVTGPGNWPSAELFVLATERGDIPVYAAGVANLLRPLVGHRLGVRGKVIDVSREGGDRELWLGSVLWVAED